MEDRRPGIEIHGFSRRQWQQIFLLHLFAERRWRIQRQNSEVKGKRRGRKLKENLGFVKSLRRCWCHRNDDQRLKYLFAHQLALNLNRCVSPNSLWCFPNDGYLLRTWLLPTLEDVALNARVWKDTATTFSQVFSSCSPAKHKKIVWLPSARSCLKMGLVCSPSSRSETPRRGRMGICGDQILTLVKIATRV